MYLSSKRIYYVQKCYSEEKGVVEHRWLTDHWKLKTKGKILMKHNTNIRALGCKWIPAKSRYNYCINYKIVFPLAKFYYPVLRQNAVQGRDHLLYVCISPSPQWSPCRCFCNTKINLSVLIMGVPGPASLMPSYWESWNYTQRLIFSFYKL